MRWACVPHNQRTGWSYRLPDPGNYARKREGGDTVEYLPTEYILAFIHVDLPDFQRIVLKNDLMIDDGDTI